MKPLEPIAPPRLLHQYAQRAIRDYVIENNLSGGDALPGENVLARQLGISRNSVREAVRALESTGVLEVRRGRGIFVRDFSFEPLLEGLAYGLVFQLREVAELVEIRCVLETGMIARAVEAMPPERLASLRAVVDRMGELARQHQPFEEEDRSFHALLFQGIDNETFLRLLDVFWRAYRDAASRLGTDPDPEGTWRDHAAILDAIAARDADRARAALDRHYSGLKDRLAAAQQQDSGR